MEDLESKDKKYTRPMPHKLRSWEDLARKHIYKWLREESYRDEICKTTMINEYMGPFTKFLYHFSSLCQAPWGVLIDFDEKKQRVFLPDAYYKWMHMLRDEIQEAMES